MPNWITPKNLAEFPMLLSNRVAALSKMALLLVLGFTPVAFADSEFSPIDSKCPQIYAKASLPLKISSMDRRLLCGDPQIEEWKDVPLEQAKRQMQVFLQNAGYHAPTLTISNDKLYVTPGPLTKITKLKVFFEASDQNLSLEPDPKFLNVNLTPKVLDEIENWVKSRLARRGYPCFQLTTKANPANGEVRVIVKDAVKRKIAKILVKDLPELKSASLRRSFATSAGEVYNLDFIDLTNARIRSSGLVTSSYFLEECMQDEIVLRHNYSIGDSRLIRLGVGANSEELGIFRAQWSNIRTNSLGSSLTFRLRVSPKNQRLSTNYDLYFSEVHPRRYVSTLAQFERKNGRIFESVNIKVSSLWRNSWDLIAGELRFGLGPVGNFEQLIDGVGPRKTTFLSLDFELAYESHYFELYRNDPREGFFAALKVSATNDLVLSPISATLIELSFKYLINVWDYENPPLILGVRSRLASTLHSKSRNPIGELPVSFRQFIGGGSSVRGFKEDSIPGDSLGSISSAYIGFEARTTVFPHPKLQPFVFADFGGVGTASMAINEPYFWSPGIGMRWASPVGVFRVSVAQGYRLEAEPGTSEKAENLQFYLGFGEEF